MKKIQIVLNGCLFLIILITSCKKPDDIKPEIQISSPVENQTVAVGASFDFKALFKDNKELGQYKIDIHDDLDGHGHRRGGTPWTYMIINDLTGQEQEATLKIQVPLNTLAGPYHFTVKCFDKAGNEAEPKTVTITVAK